MASNLETLNEFLKTINISQNNPNYHDVTHLMTLFCPDDANHPFVGITLRGPQFKNQAAIKKLFNQLLVVSFPDMAWTPANALRPTDGSTIAIEIDVTGSQISSWFQDSFKSDPLSQIDDETIAGLIQSDQTNQMDIPACAVFTFDAKYRVQQLAIYLDRYRMMDQLAPKRWSKIRLPKKTHPGAVRVGELESTTGTKITITIEN
jgi:hypothetical protein